MVKKKFFDDLYKNLLLLQLKNTITKVDYINLKNGRYT